MNTTTDNDYQNYDDFDVAEEAAQKKDDSSCWNCGSTRFVDGYAGMTICMDCKEIQDEDEDEFSRDDRYDHW